MTNKIRLKKSLKDFDSYSADKTNFAYRLNANESPFSFENIFNSSALEKKFLKSMKIKDINEEYQKAYGSQEVAEITSAINNQKFILDKYAEKVLS